MQGALLGKWVVGVSAGDEHTAAITDAGELFTWGSGDRGQLGDGRLGHDQGYEEDDEEDTLVPTQLLGQLRWKRVVTVSAGGRHTAAVTESGELYVWGDRVACGSAADVNAPRHVGGALSGSRVVAVSAGAFHTAVLTAM